VPFIFMTLSNKFKIQKDPASILKDAASCLKDPVVWDGTPILGSRLFSRLAVGTLFGGLDANILHCSIIHSLLASPGRTGWYFF